VEFVGDEVTQQRQHDRRDVDVLAEELGEPQSGLEEPSGALLRDVRGELVQPTYLSADLLLDVPV
jgi:hypothetical protein